MRCYIIEYIGERGNYEISKLECKWNKSMFTKRFLDSFHQLDADIFCVQETKMQSGQADLEIEGYHYYLNSAVKKGYSGTLIYSKEKPLNVFME